jgi:flavodoxin
MPKTLIVFYSRTGNTRRVAIDLAGALGADTEELVDTKSRKGILGFITGGRDAMKGNLTRIAPLAKKAADYDLVIIGSPNWGGNITPAVRTYLDTEKSDIKDYAFFVTAGGNISQELSAPAATILGKDPSAFSGFITEELKNKERYEKKLAEFINAIRKVTGFA